MAPPAMNPLERRMLDRGFLTPAALAAVCDVSESTIANIIASRVRNPRSAKLAAIAQALGCSVVDLTVELRAWNDAARRVEAGREAIA